MNGNTKNQITTIRNKVMSLVSDKPEFQNDDAVIALAVNNLFQELKKKKLL